MARRLTRQIRPGWLVALVLSVPLVLDLPLDAYDPSYDGWWVLPCAVPLIVCASWAPRWYGPRRLAPPPPW
ncbi:hypothetical protein [Actinoplanes awajinensis]|uniref:Uncharacterized protein n=1 Tax=Actinoplanes awajinensis subsp. mycoplanecinus TaxID=135947 RepID=A0A124G8A4_9ACTN|nr:hypothetical protein [Actinoplanes awajinensis]KUL25317.1 hypothetical protein ADL15_41085 [Actinoplanes awajinensis subsp. mycoplanecinus]